MTKPIRALIVVRLSRQVDESTSAERQIRECSDLCERLGWEVIGIAEDLNVSAGATTPFQRPELRQWIGDGLDDPGQSHEIDAVVFWRLDRLVRSMIQLADVMKWAERYGVVLKSATEPHFDMSTQMGKIIASLVASFAEMELEAIRERITADQQHRIQSGNFRGSLAPWGYRPVHDPDKGTILVQDPDQVRQIQLVVDKVFEGVPLQRIADQLNQAGELTPRDRNHQAQGRNPKGYKWNGGRLKLSLESKTLLGYIVARDRLTDKSGKPKKDSKGRNIYGDPYVVTEDDGTPKVRAEPILTRATFDKLQAELTSRENQSHVTSRSNSLLLGVLHCGFCGNVAYRLRGSKGRKLQYRCRTKQDGGDCSSPTATVDLEWIDSTCEEWILGLMGDARRRVRIWDEGEDHSGEILELETRLKDLIPLLGTRAYKPGTRPYELLQDQIEKVSARLDQLQSKGIKPSGWIWKNTDERFSDWWDSSSVEEKNTYLQAAGIRIEYRHRADRKRGDRPDLNIIVEDVNAVSRDFGGSQIVKNLQTVLKNMPARHNLVIQDGKAELMVRDSISDQEEASK